MFLSNFVSTLTLCPANCTCQLTFIECNNKNLTRILYHVPNDISGLELTLNNVERIFDHTFANFKNLFYLHISAPKLIYIDDLALFGQQDLISLSLLDTKLMEINEKLLIGLKGLVRVQVSRNHHLSKIHGSTFSSTTKLKEVTLDDNRILSFDWSTFIKLTELRRLTLRGNQLENMHSDLFLGLPKLQILVLDGNNLKLIPNQLMYPLKALTFLSLSNNNMAMIENKTFSKLSKLQILRLDNNQLSLPFNSEILSYVNDLKQLYLDNNNLLSLQDETFSSLDKLSTLCLKHNLITELREKLFKGLWSIRKIDLSYNYMNQINKNAFSNLSTLFNLDLSNNKIKVISASTFKDLTKLSSLNLKRNNITEITKYTFSPLRRLLNLDLSYNPLLDLDTNIFKDLLGLRILNLQNCKLSALTNVHFSSLKNLRLLYLSSNGLKHIPDDMLSGLTHLQGLYMRNNMLRNLSAKVFSNVTNLKTLDLRNNNLEWYAEEAFQKMEKLNELNLSKNNLKVVHKDSFVGLRYLVLINLSRNNIYCLDRRLLFYLLHMNDRKKTSLKIDFRQNQISCSFHLIKTLEIFKILSLLIDCVLDGLRISSDKLNSDILTKGFKMYKIIEEPKLFTLREKITKMAFLNKQFVITLDFQCYNSSDLASIILFKCNNNDTKIIEVQYKHGILDISHQVNLGKMTHAITNLSVTQWNTIEIMLRRIDDSYHANYLINGLKIHSYLFNEAFDWQDVSVYSKFNLDQTAPLNMREFRIYMAEEKSVHITESYRLNNAFTIVISGFVLVILIRLSVRKQRRMVQAINSSYVCEIIAEKTKSDNECFILEIGIALLIFHVDFDELVRQFEKNKNIEVDK